MTSHRHSTWREIEKRANRLIGRSPESAEHSPSNAQSSRTNAPESEGIAISSDNAGEALARTAEINGAHALHRVTLPEASHRAVPSVIRDKPPLLLPC